MLLTDFALAFLLRIPTRALYLRICPADFHPPPLRTLEFVVG